MITDFRFGICILASPIAAMTGAACMTRIAVRSRPPAVVTTSHTRPVPADLAVGKRCATLLLHVAVVLWSSTGATMHGTSGVRTQSMQLNCRV